MKEALAIEAVMHENYTRYLTTLTIVNAIIAVGNTISSSLAGGGGGSSGDAFKKTMDELKNALMPGEKARTDRKTEQIKRILEEETAKGPIKIKAMSGNKKKKGSLKRS